MVIYKGKLYRIEISLCCSTDTCLTAYDNSTPTAVQEMDADTKKVVVLLFFYRFNNISVCYKCHMDIKVRESGKNKTFHN